MANFDFKPTLDIAAMAALKQRQAQAQAEMDQKYSQQRGQMIQEAVQSASSVVDSMVQRSKNKQKADFIKSLGDAMAAQVPQQNVTLPQAGPAVPDYSNPTTDVSPMGPVSEHSSLFPDATGNVGMNIPAQTPLPPVQTTQPDFNKMNAIRASVKLDPKTAADNYLKSTNPTAAGDFELKTGADGKMYKVNKLTGAVAPVGGPDGFQTNAVTADQRKTQMDVNQQNADTRAENAGTNASRFVAVQGNKFADATDVTKMPDYSRLTAAKRLDQFVQANSKGPITAQMMKDASIMLASMLNGGGKGAVVAEGLIDDVTPKTLKGNAMNKLQWLTSNPQDVGQGKFLEIMKHTSDREAAAAEDNLRQHQVEAIRKYGGKMKQLDPKRYQEVLDSTGLSEENIDEKGRFKRTAKVRSLLPNYMDNIPSSSGGTDLGNGFSYVVK